MGIDLEPPSAPQPPRPRGGRTPPGLGAAISVVDLTPFPIGPPVEAAGQAILQSCESSLFPIRPRGESSPGRRIAGWGLGMPRGASGGPASRGDGCVYARSLAACHELAFVRAGLSASLK